MSKDEKTMNKNISMSGLAQTTRVLKKVQDSVLAITGAILIYTFWTILFGAFSNRDSKTNIIQFEQDFFTTTDKLINNKDSVLINIETIKKIFNSIDRKSNGELFTYGFINLLEDYSVYLITDTNQVSSENFPLIIDLINEELKGEPFNQLKVEQRRILLTLQKSIMNNDIEVGIYNMNELNDIFRIQNEYIEKLEKRNSWSIPLAIAGIILSLIFGLSSIINFITSRKGIRLIAE